MSTGNLQYATELGHVSAREAAELALGTAGPDLTAAYEQWAAARSRGIAADWAFVEVREATRRADLFGDSAAQAASWARLRAALPAGRVERGSLADMALEALHDAMVDGDEA